MTLRKALQWSAVWTVAVVSLSGAARAQESSPSDLKAQASCSRIRWDDYSRVQDGPARIVDSQVVQTGNAPPYCQVEGVVSGRTRFTARFPITRWNGKLVEVGTGGQAGTIMDEHRYELMGGRPGLVERGYAFLAHDAGHVGTRSGVDTTWGVNNRDGMVDYGFRSAHATSVIGKEILRRFYGRAADRSFYHSCSNGGREAMMMAQRYPWDFDGIIAAAPSMAYSNEVLGIFWLSEQLRDQSRNGLDTLALTALHKSVLAQCDKRDGQADGVLDDPRKCRVNFDLVKCSGAASPDCLTERQIEIARRIYDGPRRADGTEIATSSVMPGSELALIRMGAKYASPDGELYWFARTYASDMLRDLAFDPAPGPGWAPDPAQLDDYAKRMSLMDALFSATNPDMRAFRDRGGKLLVYIGWNDVLGGVRAPIDYYETVQRLIGSEKQTQHFFRLFMIPGMDHCTGGDGVYEFDWLGALERWVETDKGPDVLLGHRPNSDGTVGRARQIKAYRRLN